MKEYLLKRKKAGYIDFMEVPLLWGISHKEFLGYDLKNKYFFKIFYDNKYREDKLDINLFLRRIDSELENLKDGLDDRGIYNTKELYNDWKKQKDFINNLITPTI